MRKINVEQLSGIVKRNGTDPVIFLGAGASATSGVPMAYDMAMQAARWAATINRGWLPGDPRILESDVLNFLHSQSWFSQDMAVDDFYQRSMWLLNSPREQRRQFLIHVLQSVSEPSSGYHHLVKIVKERVVRTMLTTNFDDRLVKAFGSGLLITVADPHEYQRINTAPLHPQLIHLHGVAEHYMDRITEEEVQNLDASLIAQVLPLLRDHPPDSSRLPRRRAFRNAEPANRSTRKRQTFPPWGILVRSGQHRPNGPGPNGHRISPKTG